MTDLTVHAVGSKVIISDDIDATITGISIKADSSVTYLVVWWEAAIRREGWVTAAEVFSGKNPQPYRIGFTRGN